ncbi:putative lipoprotein [Plesiocystis pacifica SIR-1]|uniref:Putative lipoprotein n=1 Tax=Plesiocystis pacifica SIR-1 TaxID=391625 RepID=A6G4R8_9BACT|nr:hypothetical protein [Plesiocystis pacifica]EDM79188.1 putative lipoprotein [Plesiocystis pacifica SIR-1]
MATTGCPSDDGGEDEAGETAGDEVGGDLVEVNADINEDTTWTADKIYVLTSEIYVNGATLTIEPGTLVRGASGSALIIEKDAMLVADGTADEPIVFTSNNIGNSPTSGDWGGLVLLGTAGINLAGGIGQAEGFTNPPEYGGGESPDTAHNCGTLRYVRVEYAGFAISEGNELNGITFFACGTDTTVSYVQSHMGLDDGIEMFGGGFDADHIVVTGANDDSLDMDQGFQGRVQHVFIHQNPEVGDNCFEVSNQGTDFAATPKTNPEICNATCVGSGSTGEKSKGLTIKEGTHGSWYASIFTNATNEATNLSDDATADEAVAGNIAIENNIFVANLGATEHASGSDTVPAADWAAWIADAARANLTDDPGLASADWGAPNPMPANDVTGNGMGCDGTSYIGAVDPAGEDWTAASWINYVP